MFRAILTSAIVAIVATAAASCPGQDAIELPRAQPIPAWQVLPHADDQTAIELDQRELARVHFAPRQRRPFLYPLVGLESGRSLTRMGHPHDPHSHSHHNSVWVAHHDVNGVDFWGDHGKGKGTIATRRVARYEDGDHEALLEFEHVWRNETGETLLEELRTVRFRPLEEKGYLVLLDLRLAAPPNRPATLGKTPFGLVGVRMAKTIGVHDGGGTIRNSAGGRDEAEVLWQRARWVDYSGPIAPRQNAGVTLMDHPDNPRHPTFFHVRNDGWMGASLTHDAPREIAPGEPLHVRYGLWVHGGAPTAEAIDKAFAAFAQIGAPAAKQK